MQVNNQILNSFQSQGSKSSTASNTKGFLEFFEQFLANSMEVADFNDNPEDLGENLFGFLSAITSPNPWEAKLVEAGDEAIKSEQDGLAQLQGQQETIANFQGFVPGVAVTQGTVAKELQQQPSANPVDPGSIVSAKAFDSMVEAGLTTEAVIPQQQQSVKPVELTSFDLTKGFDQGAKYNLVKEAVTEAVPEVVPKVVTEAVTGVVPKVVPEAAPEGDIAIETPFVSTSPSLKKADPTEAVTEALKESEGHLSQEPTVASTEGLSKKVDLEALILAEVANPQRGKFPPAIKSDELKSKTLDNDFSELNQVSNVLWKLDREKLPVSKLETAVAEIEAQEPKEPKETINHPSLNTEGDEAHQASGTKSFDQNLFQRNLSAVASTSKEAPTANSYQNQIHSQLIKNFSLMHQDGVKQVNISLKPEFLGNIAINLTIENGEMIGKIAVAKKEVKELIEGQINSLKTSLAQVNIKVDQITVVHEAAFKENGMQNQAQTFLGQNQNSSKGNSAPSRYKDFNNSVEGEEVASSPVSSSYMRAQGVNYLV